MNPRRIRPLNEAPERPGPVVYWMSRDQRAEDNHAALHARALARVRKAPLVVLFVLADEFLGADDRHFAFMIEGLRETAADFRERGIPFHLRRAGKGASVADVVVEALGDLGAGALVADFDPLRVKREWKRRVLDRIDVPAFETDARNVAPAWTTSDKQEYAARTIRPKIHALLPEFLADYPPLAKQSYPTALDGGEIDWAALMPDADIGALDVAPGASEARNALDRFIDEKLDRYADKRNDPNADAQSRLSAYLHFGQLSAQRAAWEVRARKPDSPGAAAFLEELIVRRELADNYALHNPNYDTLEGAPEWARKTLEEASRDEREYLYDYDQFHAAATHDEIWNATQNHARATGWAPGYLRMYWAKKIVEWTPDPATAFEIAVRLNDALFLDGRDANGYANVAWAIGGAHDRPWQKRPVFGKIRYMNANGCRRKFDVEAYLERWAPKR
ncbi:MAG: deoxyribodipyrimidine photolyase [Ignavibacteriales bacterium]|nr:deoxyribodipyrimidine photolyase [Ignavibacteriales bacterium]